MFIVPYEYQNIIDSLSKISENEKILIVANDYLQNISLLNEIDVDEEIKVFIPCRGFSDNINSSLLPYWFLGVILDLNYINGSFKSYDPHTGEIINSELNKIIVKIRKEFFQNSIKENDPISLETLSFVSMNDLYNLFLTSYKKFKINNDIKFWDLQIQEETNEIIFTYNDRIDKELVNSELIFEFVKYISDLKNFLCTTHAKDYFDEIINNNVSIKTITLKGILDRVDDLKLGSGQLYLAYIDIDSIESRLLLDYLKIYYFLIGRFESGENIFRKYTDTDSYMYDEFVKTIYYDCISNFAKNNIVRIWSVFSDFGVESLYSVIQKIISIKNYYMKKRKTLNLTLLDEEKIEKILNEKGE